MNKDRRKRIAEIIESLNESIGQLDSVTEEEQDVYDNMPENLQGSQRYEDMEAAIDHLEEAKSSLEDAISSLEEVN